MRPRFLDRATDALEATANVVLGLAINWSVLAVVYGDPVGATLISAAMIVVSWVRQFAIRRVFRAMEGR